MTEDWPFKSPPPGEDDDNDEHLPDTSNWYEPAVAPGAETYASLPEHGVNHYAVPDAALAFAFDMHWSGKSDIEVAGSMEDDEDPAVRQSLEPLRKRIVASLMKAINTGEIDGKIKRRDFDGVPLPDWTFVDLAAVQRWGYARALGANGGYLRRFFQREADLVWDFGTAVVEERVRFQAAASPFEERAPDASALSESEKGEEIRRLTEKVAAMRQEARKFGLGQEKELDPREKTSLLKIAIGLAQGQESFDLHSMTAHKQLISLLDRAGLSMSPATASHWISELRRAHDAKRATH